MKKSKISLSFLALILVLGLVSGCTPVKQDTETSTMETQGTEEPTSGEVMDDGQSINIAEMWMFESSPTYTFSGHDLVQEGGPIETEQGTEFIFTFKSNYLGYGDRTAEEDTLVEKDVTHIVKIIVDKSGEVVKAVIDDVYDDLNVQMLQ